MKNTLTTLAAMWVLLVSAQTKTAEQIAYDWIHQHTIDIRFDRPEALKLGFKYSSEGGTTLRYYAFVNQVPIWDHEVLVHVDNNNEVSYFDSTCQPFITGFVNAVQWSANAALQQAQAVVQLPTTDIGFHQEQLFVRNSDGKGQYAYRVVLHPNSGAASWEVWVDAQTGQASTPRDIAVYHHRPLHQPMPKRPTLPMAPWALSSVNTGTAMVYNPDPLSPGRRAYAGQYVDNNDATNASLDAARVTVTLPEIDLSSGVYKLKSSYVEIKDFEAPSKGLFTQSTPNFVFNRNQDGFEAVNAFYHLDKSLRYINETLGITCRPSLNSGVLQFDPSGLSGSDNSHYLPSTDQIAFGEGGVDDAEDADVLLHEFGHGIHDWMTNGNSSSSQGLGEGSGDYWAQSYSRSLNQWLPTDDAYHFVFSWDGHNNYWDGRVTNYAATYPGGLVNDIHTDGQIWASALMQIWDALGRTKTDKAFLNGLALTNASSTQQSAAVAFRQAAINMNFPCADIQTITDVFTATGYTMPNLTLKLNCPGNQTVDADAVSNQYTLGSYANVTNAIVANCNASISQNPAIGTSLSPGTYPITMTAVSGTTTKTCTFNLTVTPAMGIDNSNLVRMFTVAPNPAIHQIQIAALPEGHTLEVYSVLGQKITQLHTTGDTYLLDVSSWSSGVYLIQCKALGLTSKFVKE